MTKEDEVQQAYEASRRCREAMADAVDIETRVSLWRCALRYRALAREKMRAGTRLGVAPALTSAFGPG